MCPDPGVFFKMAGMAQGIAELKTKYNALSNNSNTLVDRVVQWSGGRAPQLGKTYLSPGSIEAAEFKPEFYSKLPPILWGKQTYSKHKDVVDGLFGARVSSGKARQMQGKLPYVETKTRQSDKRDTGNALNELLSDPQSSAKELHAPHAGPDMLSNTPLSKNSGIPLSGKRLIPGAKPILTHSLAPRRADKDMEQSPDPSFSRKLKGKEAGPGGDTQIRGNPFSLENPDLKQQSELLEQNPIRARRMILEAGRDPELFGLR